MPIKVTQLEPGLDYAVVVAEQFNPAEFPAHVAYDPATGVVTKYFSDPAPAVDPGPVDPADPLPTTGDTGADVLKRLDRIVAQLDTLIGESPTDKNPGSAPFWKKWLGLG